MFGSKENLDDEDDDLFDRVVKSSSGPYARRKTQRKIQMKMNGLRKQY